MPDLPRCFGPYLRYAISTGFRNFTPFDEESRLFFLVEFKDPAKPEAFVSAMQVARSPVDLGLSEDGRYYTLLTTKSAVTEQEPLDVWDDFVTRVELSLPLKPTEELAFVLRKAHSRSNGADPTGRLLIGVLDDGCPFAAAQFLKASTPSGITTRVRAIWDQTGGRHPVDVTDGNGQPCKFGQELGDFNYGLEFRRSSEKPGGAAPRRIGLDEWMALHSTPAGSIDEDSCYADAGLLSLAHHASHGAHVTDVFAGRIPPSSRVGPPADRRDPPSWQPMSAATDPTGSVNDVVFVQFARSCLRDATGVWLLGYVYDAILYILSHADKQNTEHVVINLSYGPTTGPHNGTALLERVLTRLVRKYDGSSGKPKLEIVLATGNSYASDGHVFYCRTRDRPDHIAWTWRLLPDNTTSCFVEVWMKTAVMDGVTVTLTSPSGRTYVPSAPPSSPPTPLPQAGVDLPNPWGVDDTMWRLQIEATVAGSGTEIEVAEHGDWTIKVTGIRENAEVHAYVARTDPNMNIRTGAKRSYFADASWERGSSAEAGCKYVNGEFDRKGSLVERHGTLNGIATDQENRVRVAGSYILSNQRKASYSSAGPARSGPFAHRVGPDYLLLGDEDCALEGVRAGGNRSGSIFRLIGTSAAAPQLARWVTRPPPLPTPTNRPTMGNREQEEERGAGNLPPP